MQQIIGMLMEFNQCFLLLCITACNVATAVEK